MDAVKKQDSEHAAGKAAWPWPAVVNASVRTSCWSSSVLKNTGLTTVHTKEKTVQQMVIRSPKAGISHPFGDAVWASDRRELESTCIAREHSQRDSHSLIAGVPSYIWSQRGLSIPGAFATLGITIISFVFL